MAPLQASEELKKFKPENNVYLEPNEELEIDMDVKEAPRISASNEDESKNSAKATIFDLMKDIKIENVKSRKGRPKGSLGIFYGKKWQCWKKEKTHSIKKSEKKNKSKMPKKLKNLMRMTTNTGLKLPKFL